MAISSSFWLTDITNWWRQQVDTHPKYSNLSNEPRNIVSIIPHGVEVEASVAFARDIIGWRQSTTTGKMLWEKVEVRQFAWANTGILAGNYTALDTTETENDLELKKDTEEW